MGGEEDTRLQILVHKIHFDDISLPETLFQVWNRAEALELPINHYRKSIAEGFTLLHTVRREDNGTAFFEEVLNFLPETTFRSWIHS